MGAIDVPSPLPESGHALFGSSNDMPRFCGILGLCGNHDFAFPGKNHANQITGEATALQGAGEVRGCRRMRQMGPMGPITLSESPALRQAKEPAFQQSALCGLKLMSLICILLAPCSLGRWMFLNSTRRELAK